MNRSIPCVLMRAGTSRGPFFLREWLPDGDEARDQALIGAIGASDPLQLDGVGGGSTLNSKVAIVSRSKEPGCDLDYLFAQVGVGHRSVDTRPNCGNMLSGVAPFAIEQGLIAATDDTTSVRVYNVNTQSRIDVTVRTPGGRVTYEGDARIDGVAGTAAPILLNFLDAWGAVTGKVFPTGKRIDTIDGTEVTCIDAAMPLMIVRARDLGVTGREKPAALDANTTLLERLESLRLEAGRRMGLGDVSNSVIPKPVLVSTGESDDSITSRYFTPRKCHASHAVTGAIGVASAFALPGTVASGTAREPGRHTLVVLHPAGQIDVEVELKGSAGAATVERPRPHGAKNHARRTASARLRVLPSRSTRRSVARLPAQNPDPHRADARRWRQRHDGSHHRGQAGTAARPGSAGRQPGRGERCHCKRVRGELRAGRPHLDVRLRRYARDEPGPAKFRLRPGQRFRARRACRFFADLDGHIGGEREHVERGVSTHGRSRRCRKGRAPSSMSGSAQFTIRPCAAKKICLTGRNSVPLI